MQIMEVSETVVNEVLMKKMNEVRTRNPNTGTLVEVVQRDNEKGIVEKFEHQESGTYETTDPQRAGHKDPSSCSTTPDEGLQGT
jgi:hypothetical protein